MEWRVVIGARALGFLALRGNRLHLGCADVVYSDEWVWLRSRRHTLAIDLDAKLLRLDSFLLAIA